MNRGAENVWINFLASRGSNLPSFTEYVIDLTKPEAATMENRVAPKSRRMREFVYGSHDPANMTPNGRVEKNGGGAVASIGGPGRCCVNAANVTSDNDTAVATGSSNLDVAPADDFGSAHSSEPPFLTIQTLPANEGLCCEDSADGLVTLPLCRSPRRDDVLCGCGENASAALIAAIATTARAEILRVVRIK